MDDARRREHIMNRRNATLFTALTALALVVGFCRPAAAHTPDQQAAWMVQWEERALHARFDETVMAELADFITRHTQVSVGSAGPPFLADPTEPVTYAVGVEQWRTLVTQYFPADQVDKALQVMACESNGDPNADNPRSTAAGLFQFLSSTWARTPYAAQSVYDPTANVAAAAWLWGQQGWAPWVCA
jgi:hypothetical protein